MDDQDNDFDRIENAAADRRRQQNFDDLQNELSGSEVGRIPRFLSAEARQILLDKRNGKPSAAMSALDMALMSDPHYAKVYSKAIDQLSMYDDATARALEKAQHISDVAQAELEDVLERAAKLSDGTRVFRDGNGAVWTEDHQRVDQDNADKIEWQGSEPSYERFIEKENTSKTSDHYINEIRRYQTDVLGAARDRVTDQDNPLSATDIENEMNDLRSRMPDAVKLEIREDIPANTRDTAQTFDLAIPDLGS